MTEQPETPAAEPEKPQRVALRYTGEQTLTIVASAHANPSIVETGAIVVVDAWAAEYLDGSESWSRLAGEALDEALRGLGLSTSGTADAKRDRLAQHEAELAAQQTSSTDNTPEDTDR